MKKRVYLEKEYGYAIDENIDVYFKFDNTTVYTTGGKTKGYDNQGVCDTQIIKMVTYADIESFYGTIEVNRITKSEILVIQSMITFFTGVPFVEYCGYRSESCCFPIEVGEKDFIFRVGEKDYTSDLLLLLNKVEKDKETVISLLDRWRKASYLVEESTDANLYHDEAILDYFHIIELLSEIHKDELKTKMNSSLNSLLKNFYKENLIYNDNQIEEKVNKNKYVLSDILITNEITISQKSKYFLAKYEILDEVTCYFLDDLIITRNAIAHGRKIYKKNALWPVSPFFYLAQNSYDNISTLSILTARMISGFVGMQCWTKEWEAKKCSMLPPQDKLNSFLKNVSDFSEITAESLIIGNSLNISWDAIFWYYSQNPKKFSIQRISSAMKDFYRNTVTDEISSYIIFNISVVLSDSEDNDISQKARENVKLIVDKQWYPWSNFKDIYSYLEYKDIPPIWYKQFLENR